MSEVLHYELRLLRTDSENNDDDPLLRGSCARKEKVILESVSLREKIWKAKDACETGERAAAFAAGTVLLGRPTTPPTFFFFGGGRRIMR
jgi:hypothetical protein